MGDRKGRVYISGPMTGYPELNRREFEKAEELLSARGYEVVNPHKAGKADMTWEENMRLDIAEMMSCDSVYALRGWEGSRGASIEVALARDVGIRVEEELGEEHP